MTSGQLTVTTKMSFGRTINNEKRKKFISAARNGRLEDVIVLSNDYSNDVIVLSEALVWSCENGHLNVVDWLKVFTAADVNYNSRGLWPYTPLTAASANDHFLIVNYLIEQCYADVNLTDKEGDTSLIKACRNVSMSLSMYLLCEVRGLEINIANNVGNTALHYAVWYNKEYITPLHEACVDGDVTEVSRLVLHRGHNVNVQNNAGFTPLHYACYYGHSDIVITLMFFGADEKIINDGGETPAQLAEKMRHNELLKFWIEPVYSKCCLNS